MHCTLAALMALLVLSACATPPPSPPPAPEPEPDHWGYSRTVETKNALISLFDPTDLVHHQAEPANWYRQGFAYQTDLATGRFAAVLTETNGRFAVRVTSAPLTTRELAVAGPQATLRLRVQNRRLLLAGGDAWPSREFTRPPAADDPRWLSVPDGDYRVTITVLGDSDPPVHNFVFQLEAVDSIDDVAYAPGMPQLVFGQPPAVAANNVSELRYRDRCGDVPANARWSPLVGRGLPIPGATTTIETIEKLHERGRELQSVALPADAPLVVGRELNVGSLAVLFVPDRWLEPRRENDRYRELLEVEGYASCAVRVTGVEDIDAERRVVIEPLSAPRDRLPAGLALQLVDRFDSYIAVRSDPAWRYKSAWVRNAPDETSLVLGVMDHLDLLASDIELLLPMSNAQRVRALLELMEQPV